MNFHFRIKKSYRQQQRIIIESFGRNVSERSVYVANVFYNLNFLLRSDSIIR